MSWILLCFLSRLLFANANLWVVDIRSVPMATQLSVRVCAGLFNRDEAIAGAVYTLEGEQDEGWLQDTYDDSYDIIHPKDFLPECLNADVVKGYIHYAFTAQQLLLPNIVTLAGVLDAIPLEGGEVPSGLPLAFDALKEFSGFDALDATKYVFDRWGQETTAMSKMNPGLEAEEYSQFSPKLTGTPELELSDFVVKQKLFNYFLWWGCIEGTDEEALTSRMALPENNPWPNPIPVWGYDNSWLVGGYLFEASTHCSDSKNMGTIPSAKVSNLSFFSRKEPIKTPLETVSSSELDYSGENTYITFVIGDGDNLEFVKSTRKDWMQERVQRCDVDEECFPLVWSLSPHLLTAAPDIFRWYQNQAQITGQDYFVLPPSGHLYSYPAQMPADVQKEYVRLTENDARLMNTNGVVSWDVTGSWDEAFASYLPRYANKNIVQAIFAMNVPYLMPIWSSPFEDSYRVVRDNVVVFRPRSWRGTDERVPREFHKTVDDMAKEINEYPKGSVNYIYTTSDGGFNLDVLYELVARLDGHVQVVDSKQLASLALQRSRALCSSQGTRCFVWTTCDKCCGGAYCPWYWFGFCTCD